MSRQRLSKQVLLAKNTPPFDGDDRPTKEQASSKLRKEAWKWFKLRKAVPFCLAAVLGLFAVTGDVPKAMATDQLVNYEQYDEAVYRDGGAGIWGYYYDGNWTTIVPGYRFNDAIGGNTLQTAVSAAITSGGGNVWLTTTRTNGTSVPTPGSGTRRYRTNWADTVADPNKNFYTGTLTVNNNASQNINIRDERNSAYTIGTIDKLGVGDLALSTTTTVGINTSFTSSFFNGRDGSLTLGANYTSTTTEVGASGGGGTFKGVVGDGFTWATTSFATTDDSTFTKDGGGALTSVTSDINGTANMIAGRWDATTIHVGYTADGKLNISRGTVNADNFYVGASGLATGDVDMTGGILNTGMNGGTTQIGAWNTGTVWLHGTGGALGTPLWNAQGYTQIGVGGTGTVTLEDYSNWISTATTDVGSSSGQDGYVNIDSANANWYAEDQIVNIGFSGTGEVNQSAGTWTNETTNIGVNGGSEGTVNQSGGTHTDTSAYIGLGSTGTYNLSNGAHWNTRDSAVIGDQANSLSMPSDGTVNVQGGSSLWFIVNDLTVANRGWGKLNISNEGMVEVQYGDVVVGFDDSGIPFGNQGTVNVADNGSELRIDRGDLTVAYGGESIMNITAQGLVDVQRGGATIGDLAGVKGTVNVEDFGSRFHVQNGLTVGQAGEGILNIGMTGAGAVVEVTLGDIVVSAEVDSIGLVNVNGDDSVLIGYNGNMIVGQAGDGELNVTDGGTAEIRGSVTAGTGNATIGDQASGKGVANIDGIDSTFIIQENLIVANDGLGDLTVTDGALTHVKNGNATIGNNNTGTAKIDSVDSNGKPSTLLVEHGNLYVGQNATGTLEVTDGALTDVYRDAVFGNTVNGDGTGLISRPGSELLVRTGDLVIANEGTATVTTKNGALTHLESGDVLIAVAPGSTGTKNVDGSGSIFQIDQGDVTVGVGGTGAMNVTNGGVTNVENGDVVAGKFVGSYGEINVDGPGSELNIKSGDLTVADGGDDSKMGVINGGVVNLNGNATIAAQQGVHGFVTVSGDGSEFNVTENFIVGEKGYGELLAEDKGVIEIDGNLITGHLYDSTGTVTMLTGGLVIVHGDDIIGDESGSFGHQNLSDVGTVKTVDGTQVVGNFGQAGGRYWYYQQPAYPDIPIGSEQPPLLVDPTPWAGSPNVTLTWEHLPAWYDIEHNAPGLAITYGAQEISNRGEIGKESGGYGYVLIDDKNNTNPTFARWDVTEDMLIGGQGEAYVRVLNGGQLNVGTELTIGNDGYGNDGGTLRVEGIQSGKRATVTVGTDMLVGVEALAEGNLYANSGASVEVGGDMIFSQKSGSLGRAHFDGSQTTASVADTLIVGDAGQSGRQYQYVPGNEAAADPTVWLDSPNTLNYLDPNKTVYNVPYGNVIQDNMPGMVISDRAVVTSDYGIVGNTATGYGYVVIDNKSATGTPNTRATWDVLTDLTVANFGDAYVRVLNGGVLSVENDMTVAKESGSEGTVRVNGVNPNKVNERATLTVGNDLVIAEANTAEGNLYAYLQADIRVANNMTISQDSGSHGRAHFDGDKTTADIGGTLTVGDAGASGQRYQYISGAGNDADPTRWFDSGQTLDSLTTHNYDGTGQNDMPGLLISDGAVVKSAAGVVAADTTGYGYVVIDNNNGTAATTRATWDNTGNLIVGNLGDAYLRVLNGGLLQVGGDMTVAAGDGTTNNEGTVRVNGINPDQGTAQRSTMTVAGSLTVADATGTHGNLYIYDQAYGKVTQDMTIAAETDSYGRAHIDGYDTKLDVTDGKLTVGEAGIAGKIAYNPTLYKDGVDDNDPDVWFDDIKTLDSMATLPEAPGMIISRGAEVTSASGMVGNVDGSMGYVTIDGRKPDAGRSQWTIANDLMVANDGTALVRVNNGALLDVGGDLVTADGNGVGDIRVYGTNRDDQAGVPSKLIVGGTMVSGGGANGTGSFYLYDMANAEVAGDYIIARDAGSWGRGHIDGNGTTMRVDDTVVIGQSGSAGGEHRGASGNPSPSDPAVWLHNGQTLGTTFGANSPGLLLSTGAYLSSGNGKAAEFADSNGYMVIDGKDAGTGRTRWEIDNDMDFGIAGYAYGRVFNGALLEVGNDMTIGVEETGMGILDVYGRNPITDGRTQLIVHGNLTTAVEEGSHGNLYAFRQAEIQVDGNHIIAQDAGSLGRDYIDEAGTTMNVDGKLTVGKGGYAGGAYTEDRYDPRFGAAETKPFTPKANDALTVGDPTDWFSATERILDMDLALGSTKNAQTGTETGNVPGLAITRGAVVTSGSGMVGEETESNGYVLIDNKGNIGTPGDPITRTQWRVTENNKTGENGNLTIGGAGTGFVRVLNGALLHTDSLTVNGNGGDGTLHVVGNGAVKDADGNYVKIGDEGALPIDRDNYVYQGMYIAQPYTDGFRSEWINLGAAVLGENAGGTGTIRINDGGYGETCGLYIGLAAGSEGAVSVMGYGSLLRVFEDTGSPYKGSVLEGSSTLSVSDHAWVSMQKNSEILLNGNGMFSNGAVLHLEKGSVIDAMTDRVSFVNARIEGIGSVFGKKGVHVTQDDVFTPPGTQAEIDPGLAYSWAARCEDNLYYGTLTFGDQLLMSGNVITYFDVNSGMNNPFQPAQQDLIVVTRGESPNTATVSDDPILAELSGTLMVHARLTDYYKAESDVLVVKTIGDDRTGPGRILSMYDELTIQPWRFFNGREQYIEQDAVGNEDLYIRMTLNEHPFEEAGITYNQRQTGRGLDSIYAERNQDWLPFLRSFWYLDDPEFLNGFKDYGGEVRAHTLRMPLRNPWLYIPDRVDGTREVFHNGQTPCDQTDVDLECSRYGQYRRQYDKYIKGTRLWGSYILEEENVGSDGNAYGYDLRRYGLAIGIDHNLKNENTYVGFMFAFDEGKLNTYRAGAESDDFNFGFYHRTRFQRDWEWKNYLGFGVQHYDMWRDADLNLTPMEGNGWKYECHDEHHAGRLTSHFNGTSFAASTELSREFVFGCTKQWTAKPFMALDLNGFWQGAGREANRFSNYTYDVTYDPTSARYVALDYHRTSDVRLYLRPGVGVERAGRYGNLRALASYSFRMGGHGYTSVDNQFRYGGKAFNIHGVDDGIGFVTVNLGGGVFLDRKKTSMASIDYRVIAGEHSTAHTLQLGAQKKF